MNKTKIEWALNPDGTPGYTWNPITGCLNGCSYCYARKLANTRLKERYLANRDVAPLQEGWLHKGKDWEVDSRYDAPFYPRFREDRLHDRGLFQDKPRGIFTCDMSDLFGIGVPEAWTDRVMDNIKAHRQHRFYLLTKQPQNLPKSPSYFPDNCWVGVSSDGSFDMTGDAIANLQFIEARVKFISFEPLLNENMVSNLVPAFTKAGIKWVIIGSQTKPYKPPQIEWVQEIVEACDKAGIPVFLKDNLKQLIFDTNSLDLCTKVVHGESEFDGLELTLRQEMPEYK